MSSEVLVRFFSTQEKYAVPDTPFSVSVNFGINEFNAIINNLLSDVHGKEDGWKSVDFDFLIGDEFVRLPLGEHLQSKTLSTESVIDIQYIERHPVPKPEASLEHDDWVSSIHASDKWILSASYDSNAYIWNTNLKKIRAIEGHLAPVKAVSWISVGDPVSTFVTTSHDQSAVVWEWNSLRNSVICKWICRGHDRSVESVAVSDDKTKIATGSWDNMVKVWSTEADENDHFEEMGQEGTHTKRLKIDTGKSGKNKTPIVTLAGHTEGVSAVQWTDVDEVCTSSWDHTIRLWSVELGGMKDKLIGNKTFFDISFSPLNQTLLSTSADAHVRMWDLRNKCESVMKCAFTSHTAWVTCVRWSSINEYQFVSGSQDWKVKQWDVRCPKAPLYDLTGHTGNVLCCDWSNKNFILSGGSDNYLRAYKC